MARRRSMIRELLETAVLTIIIFLVVRVALQNFKVEGFSMYPNLHDGEYILVNKISYMLHSPQRGDIVVFNATPAGPQYRDKDFIKRVIGLPGETVAVHNDSVYINGHPLSESYIGQFYRPTYNWSAHVVPPNEYFVLGDNRNDSQDSHIWGFLPKHYIIGKAWVAYWPPSELHLFFGIPGIHLGA